MVAWEWLQWLMAVLLLLPALVLVVSVGLAIRAESSGPLLFRSTREGRGAVTFSMYKLRTMRNDANAILAASLEADPSKREAWKRFGCLRNDPRIAGPIAGFARRYSIDELPQLLNVLLRQMALVGPRPLPHAIVTGMEARHRALRITLRPGITGLWQVSGRSERSIAQMGRLDAVYVAGRSCKLDLVIMFRTVRAVFSGRGAY